MITESEMKIITLDNIHKVPILVSPNVVNNNYTLKEDLYFNFGDLHFYVMYGFIWDGASIPKIAWMTTGTPFEPDHLIASLVHDFLYTYGHAMGFTRKQADKLYKDILSKCGKSTYVCWKEYRVLRLFGKKNYKKGR